MLNLVCAAVLVATNPAGTAGDPAHPALGPGTRWRIDPTHSELTFRIRHLVSRVSGTFRDWDATIEVDGSDWQHGSVAVTIRTRSIDTNNERRDNHLRSEDFFDSDRFPEMSFRSTSIQLDGSRLRLTGDLTIRGITHPVVLAGNFLGVTSGPGGHDRAGFEATTRINRLDYGVSWNRAAEGGGMLLGDEVDVAVTVEAVREK